MNINPDYAEDLGDVFEQATGLIIPVMVFG